MGNLLFFTSLIISILFFYLADKKNNKKIMICGIVILSLIAGFRGIKVGFDTAYYYDAFLRDFPKSWQFEEKGFRIISNFFMNVFNNHATVLFIIYAMITNFLIVYRLWDFRKKCNFTFMTLLYILIFFIDSMNIMRQFIAISIIFFATRLLEKKKYLWFAIIVGLCTVIHTSALLAIIIMVIYMWKGLSLKNKLLLIMPMIVFSIFGVRFIYNYGSADINNYLSTSNSLNNVNLTFIYRYIIFIFTFFISSIQTKKINVNDKKTTSELNKTEFNIISLIYMVGLTLCSLGMFYSFAARIGYYCLIFELVYWGYFTYKKKNKYLYGGMIMIYALYIFSYEVIYNGSRIFPYYCNFI